MLENFDDRLRTAVARVEPMLIKTTLLAAVSALALSVLGGCATEVAPDGEDENAVATPAPAAESTTVSPEQLNLTGPCTVKTECNRTTCCTTTDCRFTTTVNCTSREFSRP